MKRISIGNLFIIATKDRIVDVLKLKSKKWPKVKPIYYYRNIKISLGEDMFIHLKLIKLINETIHRFRHLKVFTR